MPLRTIWIAAVIAWVPVLSAAPPLPVAEALKTFTVPTGFTIEAAVAEPHLGQPVYLTFDERGRLWVVQYLQYPWPEGLKVVGHDEYWRVKYDHFPPTAPPQNVRGADKVTVFEDRDRDGYFETSRDFVGGLNITTAALPGRGGVWVLNPPYLLFYADADRDDVPDGDPVVHLAGFGLEDLHAVANSLTWGPDGWIYGCQGSTCTASITRPGVDEPPVRFSGQCLWRYRPDTREFELFAEGGFNNFGIAADRKFRLFTGTNGGKIGVHYVQGGYYQKNWGKHGPLTDPYAFGYFDAMPDQSSQAKLSQAMMWCEEGPFPAEFQGRMLVARILQQRIDLCELRPEGSSYAAFELRPVCSSREAYHRPVDLKEGPDGAVYIADWHEANVTWNVTAEGAQVDRTSGRIYRLRYGERAVPEPFDYAGLDSARLVGLLQHRQAWHRRTAQRLLGDRRDPAVCPALARLATESSGQTALEALWALHASGGFTTELANRLLNHADPFVRLWTLRLLGDDRRVTPEQGLRLVALAATEPEPQVRSQLACTARRLPATVALPIAAGLTRRSEDTRDPHLPLLLWWVIEAQLREDRAAVLTWLEDRSIWASPMFRSTIVPRLGQRFTVERRRENFLVCARLLGLAPDAEVVLQLLRGMERGLTGNRVEDVPAELKQQLGRLWTASPPEGDLLRLAVRLGSPEATPLALRAVAASATPEPQRIELIRLLAERGEPAVVDTLLALLREGAFPTLRAEALSGLQRFGDERVAQALLASLPQLDAGLRDRTLTILSTRPRWTALLLKAVEQGEITPRQIAPDIVMALHEKGDEPTRALIRKHWGNVRPTPEELRQRVQAVGRLLAAAPGDPRPGKAVFEQTCAKCHMLFGEGRKVGPDLTGIERHNQARLIEAIVDPGAAVLPEFAAFEFTLGSASQGGDEDQTIIGFVVEEDLNSVRVVDTAGNESTVPRSQIAERRALTTSIMPEGLLEAFTDQQIRDLFAYLQAQRPPSAHR